MRESIINRGCYSVLTRQFNDIAEMAKAINKSDAYIYSILRNPWIKEFTETEKTLLIRALADKSKTLARYGEDTPRTRYELFEAWKEAPRAAS